MERRTIYTDRFLGICSIRYNRKIEGATELVKWMSGVESGVNMWETAKSLPSTYEAFEQIAIFQEDENYNALYEQLSKYGHPRPKTPVYPQVSTSFQQLLESVALGGKDTQTQMDKSVERINAKLERYKKNNEEKESILGMAFLDQR